MQPDAFCLHAASEYDVAAGNYAAATKLRTYTYNFDVSMSIFADCMHACMPICRIRSIGTQLDNLKNRIELNKLSHNHNRLHEEDWS